MLILVGLVFLAVHIMLVPYETKTLNVLDGLFIGFHVLHQLTGLVAYNAEDAESWYAVATVLLLLPLLPALYLVVSGNRCGMLHNGGIQWVSPHPCREGLALLRRRAGSHRDIASVVATIIVVAIG